jgi:hypothetical protein
MSLRASKRPQKFETQKTVEKTAKVENCFLSQWNRWVSNDIHMDQIDSKIMYKNEMKIFFFNESYIRDVEEVQFSSTKTPNSQMQFAK